MDSKLRSDLLKSFFICLIMLNLPLFGAWLPTEDLSLVGQDSFSPQVAMDAAGNAIAVWQYFDGSDNRVQASIKPFGGSWQIPVNLSASGQDGSFPQVAMDAAGNAIAVWQYFDGSDNRVQASTKPFGGTWQAVPDNLSAPGQDASLPQIAVDTAGNATAVWYSFDGSDNRIQASTRPFGGSWQAVPDNLSAAGQTAFDPQIFINSAGHATVVWELIDITTIIQASSKPFGGSWQAVPSDLSLPGQDSLCPQVAMDTAGNATAIWYSFNGVNYIIQISTKPFGGSWQAVPSDISTPGQDSFCPQIAVDAAGNATTVWFTFDGVNNIIQASSKPFGGSWQVVPDNLSATGLDALDPQVAVSALGNATAVWQIFDVSNYIIQASSKPFGGSWQVVPDDLSAAGLDANGHQVSMDKLGNATVIWELFNDVNTIIQARQKLVPSLVFSLSPSQGPASGQTVVQINGIGFTTAYAVFFGANPALDFIVNSNTSITAISPPGMAGTVNVSIFTLGGVSSPSAGSSFTYTTQPPPPPPPPPPPLPVPLPPQNFRGQQKVVRFLSQSDIVNVLSWDPPLGGAAPAFYALYRDSGKQSYLIAVIPANKQLKFEDHNRRKNKASVYYIATIDQAGVYSTPVRLVVDSRKRW